MLALWKAGIAYSCLNSAGMSAVAIRCESAEPRGQAESIPAIPSLSKALFLVVKRREKSA